MKQGLAKLILVLLILCLARRAWASDDDVVIDLVGASEQPPLLVCVAAPVEEVGPKKEQRPANWFFASEVFGKPENACVDPQRVEPKEPDPYPVEKPTPGKQPAPLEWSYGKCTEPVDEPKGQPVEQRAFAYLRAPQSNAVLFNTEEKCRPRLELPRGHVVQCKFNPLAGPGASGVAVIALGFSSVQRRVSFFNVDHNIVSVRLASIPSAGGSITARIAGGHYQPTKIATVEARRAQLTLEPLCYERELIIPPVDNRKSDATATVQVGEWTTKVSTTAQRVMMLIPPAGPGKTSALTLDFPSADDPEVADAIFTANWTTRAPPQKLDVRPTEVTFSWKAPCEYPLHSCPTARLAEGGQEKSSEGRGECRYRFRAPEGRAIALPAEVVFDARKLPPWRGKVSAPASTLRDYLPADGRMVRVLMPWAVLRTMVADQIESIELVGPTGTRHLLTPEAESIVGIPYAGCGTQIAYRLSGMRDYHWGRSQIRDGRLLIDFPNETAELASLGLMVGGGFEVSFTRPETRPYAQAELSVRLRPKRWGGFEETSQGVKWVAAPWYSRPDYDFTLTYIFTPQPYSPLRTADNQQDTRFETVPYNRFLLGGFMLWPIFDRVSFGPGLGGGLGYSLKGVDSDRVGGVQFFWVLPAARARYDISRRFSLVATGRVVWPDELQSFTTKDDFRGTPQSSSSSQSWLFFDFALQGWL